MQMIFTQEKLESKTRVVSELIAGQPTEQEGGVFILPLLSPAPGGKLYPLIGVKATIEPDPQEAGALRMKVSSLRYGAEGTIAEEIPLNGDKIDLRAWASAVGLSATNDSEIILNSTASAAIAPKAK